MEVKDIGSYTDAIACLRQTLNEGQKSSNVDIKLMLSNVKRCHSIVLQLVNSEKNDMHVSALESLLGSLSAHANILSRKINQLSNGGDANLARPHTPGTASSIIDTAASKQQTEQVTARTESPRCSNVNSDDDFDDKQAKARQQVIQSTIYIGGQIKFSDVIGLTEAKRSLQDAVVMPLVFPHLFLGGRKPWKIILLFGPPGTGKSRLAKAVSAEVKATFYSVSSTDLMSSWIGESEKLIKELFHHASNQTGQSVIFIDEIDSLCRKRSSREDESTRRIKTELLIQMDESDRLSQGKIFLLCATNCPWDLDTAFLRRFQKRIYIPLPDQTSRVELIKLHCEETSVDISETEWTLLANKTKGYSGSDLSTLTNGALFLPIRELRDATHWRPNKDGNWVPCEANYKHALRARMTDLPPNKVSPRSVRFEDFFQALQIHKPTVSEEEIQRFASYTSDFGQSG